MIYQYPPRISMGGERMRPCVFTIVLSLLSTMPTKNLYQGYVYYSMNEEESRVGSKNEVKAKYGK